MSHHNDRKHEHDHKVREHEKMLHRQHEDAAMKQVRVIHPVWFVVIGILLTVGVVVAWTMASAR